jgi:hypothetical protein
MAIEGAISSANCPLRLYRMSSRAHDQICAFENRVRRPSRSDWCRGPVRPCRPNTWGGRLADYLDRRHHAEQIKHFGRRPLGFLRVMIFTPNQVKLQSARSANNKLTKTTTKLYICRPTIPKGIRLSIPTFRMSVSSSAPARSLMR